MHRNQASPGPGFGDLRDGLRDYARAPIAVLPVPYERTTSWAAGTYLGPHAILEASKQLELFDEELRSEPANHGIVTLRPARPNVADPRSALDEIRAAAHPPIADGKFLLALGGEHTVTLPLVEAALDTYPDLGVVQFDAHANLRDSYDGTPYSHPCVMRRIRDLGVSTAAIGLRSLSMEEADLIAAEAVPVVWGHELAALSSLRETLADLPRQLYLSFDLGFFDPGVLPATSTPEPGGGRWHATLGLLRELFESREIVGMDIVGLAPSTEHRASDFVAARLAYKCMGLRLMERS